MALFLDVILTSWTLVPGAPPVYFTPFALPSLVWKLIVGQAAARDDLDRVDSTQAEILDMIGKQEDMSDQEFQEVRGLHRPRGDHHDECAHRDRVRRI